MTTRKALIALLFIFSFILSIIYGPRNEIADYTAVICLLSFVIYYITPLIIPRINYRADGIIDTIFWTIIMAFIIASFVRGFGMGHIFDNIFLDFAKVYFP